MSRAQSHTADEVARLLGLSLAEVRRCARAGFLTATEDGGGEVRFSFQDIVVLRRAAALMSGRVQPYRVRAALKKLRAQLKDGQAMSGVEVSSQGQKIVVEEGGERWEPLTGQMQLNFEARKAPAPLSLAYRAPDTASAGQHYDRGCELEERGDGAAEAEYRKAVEIDPAHADARVNLGRILHELGRLADAETQYRIVLKAGPHSIASFNLAVVLEDLGNEDGAIRAYQEAIAADPDCEDAYFNLARIYERRGERVAALRALKTYRSLTRR